MNPAHNHSVPIDTVGHNVVEIILGDKSIIIKIGLHEDLLHFLVVKVFS